MAWLNQRRLRDYPRLIGASFWAVFVVNLITHKGWFGGFGGIISFDFLTLYSAGLIYWRDIGNLYNLDVQAQVERMVFAPTPMGEGVNVFSSPPHVALAYSVLTVLPYTWAFLANTLLSMLAVIAAMLWIFRELIFPQFQQNGLTRIQLLILAFSFFPNLFGLFLGQNQAFSLLLVSGIILLSVRERWALAGILAGLLSYKPHFVVGFLIIWLVWRNWRALFTFAITVGVWAGGVFLTYGLAPFWDYWQAIADLVRLPYGIGRYLEVTLFALAATSLPEKALPILLIILQGVVVAVTLGLAWIAYQARHQPREARLLVYALAILYPFLTSPHILQYDLVLLIPVLAVWAYTRPSRQVLVWTIGVYLGSFLGLAITRPTGLALLALIPLGLAAAIVFQVLRGEKKVEWGPA